MYKVGDRLLCKRNILNHERKIAFTKGKYYVLEFHSVSDSTFLILNDRNYHSNFYLVEGDSLLLPLLPSLSFIKHSDFYTIEEERKLKLNKLNEI